MLGLRWLIKIPNELFRKILHFILLGSYIPFAFAFETWWLSVLLTVILEILIYPALACAELPVGKGKIIINEVDLDSHLQNPIAVRFYNRLVTY